MERPIHLFSRFLSRRLRIHPWQCSNHAGPGELFAKPWGIFPLIHFSFLELWLFNVWGMKLVWILFTFFSAPLASGYMIIPILLGLDS